MFSIAYSASATVAYRTVPKPRLRPSAPDITFAYSTVPVPSSINSFSFFQCTI